jgi:hypothetical protein
MDRGPFTTVSGPRRRWSTYTVWAEDGLILLQDHEDGTITVQTCNSIRAKLNGWAKDEAEVMDKRRTAAVNGTEKGFCNDKFHKLKEMIEVMGETLREAIAQGDQNDPEVARAKLNTFYREKLAGKYDGPAPDRLGLQIALSGGRLVVPARPMSNFKRRI